MDERQALSQGNESSLLLRALELAEDIIFITDRNGVVQYVNAAFEKVTGYRRDEVLGQPIRVLKSGRHDRRFYERVWNTLLSGKPFRAVFVNRKRDGELFYEDQTITPILDPAGRITHFVAVGKDVTAREENIQALRRLTAILENTSDFVAIARPDGRVEWRNRAARRMLGIGEGEDSSYSRILDVHPEWAARLVMEEGIPSAIREGIWRGQTAIRSRDGREIPVSQVIIAHKAADGTVEYLSMVARDISEEKRLQLALTRALALERALRAIDAALLQEESLQRVLEALCDGVISLGYRMCWVGLKEPDFTIRPVAARGFDTSYLSAMPARWDDSPLGQGPAGQAIRTRQPVVYPDVESRPELAFWQEEARRLGYRSLAAIPLTTNGQVVGVIAVYSESSDAFDADMLRSLQTLAQQGTLAVLTARQREQLQRVQQLQDFHIKHMPLAHVLWDADFRVVRWNRAAERIFGWSAEEVHGKRALDFLVPPEARAQVEAVWAELVAGKPWNHSVNPNYRRDGSRILCEWINTPVRDASGQMVGVASMAQDISEADRLRAQALEVERRFHDLAEATAEGILITDAEGRVTYANPAAERMFGIAREQMVGGLVQRLLPSAPQRPGRWEGEGVRADNDRFPVEGSISCIESRSGPLYTYVVRDLTERKRFEEQLAYLADHDPLTGLFNRRRFQQELERQLTQARHYGEQGALLFVDLDRFKEINDNLGHRAGDEVLARVASFLRSRVKETDIVARLGGDEFAVLLPRADEAGARAVAKEILEGLHRHAPAINGQPVPLSASIGIALFPRNGSSVDDLLACADTAMYEAKDAGGDGLRIGAPEQIGTTPATTRLSWERRIRWALERDAFVLYAQPILDLRTGQISQYELLLRLVDEQGRLVLPGSFLGIAERTGLIHAIDRWVVRQAIRLIAAHARRGRDLRVEVNLSALAFGATELFSLIQSEVAECAHCPGNLVLEITETAAIRDMHQARAFVDSLKKLGCCFALDDFGVGFGSFYYLKHLPVDYVKIDGSFIRNLRNDPTDPHIVRAIVEVASSMGIRTIAESAEDRETVELLREFGIHYAQGYSIGRPQPLSALGLDLTG